MCYFTEYRGEHSGDMFNTDYSVQKCHYLHRAAIDTNLVLQYRKLFQVPPHREKSHEIKAPAGKSLRTSNTLQFLCVPQGNLSGGRTYGKVTPI